MFQDGDLARGIRELSDIDGLIRAFSGIPRFFDALVERAQEMDMRRPVFYALRYTQEFLKAPIPEHVISGIQSWAPSQPLLGFMDALVERALVPYCPEPVFSPGFARWFLYVRSHWLRMRPIPLARHLIHQTFRARN